ncbi:MAG: NAD(P)H-dependent oxidoreductase [Flavobacterium sp.]
MNILHITSSPRGNESQSIILGNAIVEELQTKYPKSNVVVTDLTKTLFPHLEEVHLTSFFTPEESRSPELLEAIKHSDEAIKELFEADVIIVSTPIYNFGIPSALKAWIDHIARAGKTFNYSAAGFEGLLKNKKAYFAIASGGVFSEGLNKANDFAEPYLKAVLSFVGITDVTTFRVEGTAIPEIKETAMPKALQKAAEFEF